MTEPTREALIHAVKRMHAAKGRYHSQHATCDLYELLGLPCTRETIAPPAALASAPTQPALLFEHDDGRYAVNPVTTGDPGWRRLGPVDVSALASAPAADLTDDQIDACVGNLGMAPYSVLAGPDEIRKFARKLLGATSESPPDDWRKYATEREDTAQAVIERHRRELQTTLAMLAADRTRISELEAASASASQAQPALTVDVYRAEGDDPFICAVRGKATIEVLTEIEAAIREHADFGKGDGVYRFEPTWFAGQFGEYGQCELRPGWGFDEIGYAATSEDPDPQAQMAAIAQLPRKEWQELEYWLDRCESKGHLERCPDLIEPYQALCAAIKVRSTP